MSTLDLFYETPLGVSRTPAGTQFRVFAPNASHLRIVHGSSPQQLSQCIYAEEIAEGLWEANSARDLRGEYYTISIDPKEDFFLPPEIFQRILDPYALACYDGRALAIVMDRNDMEIPRKNFRTPKLGDIVILEGHLRDLLGLSEIVGQRPTYGDFSAWLEERDNYLVSLGMNALELQPLQEFDAVDDDEYHWGYMPVNYFSPTRVYASDKSHASQIYEFAELVRSCHRHDLAVIMDVVYNHAGNCNALLPLGGRYFFRFDSDGKFTNHSGCGNDLRTEAPMTRRLILESLSHLIDAYAVDGFRFDLADLIDGETRALIEKILRQKKTDLILIAEPWSFCGHCALALKDSSWSSWNDDFREFVRQYVCGRGNREGLKYFLAGSTAHRSRFPSQSVNYTASHDDYAWIDCLTENPGCDGSNPTDTDIRRTHMMFAILFCSLGVPQMAQGQDFLHSKGGQRNTYLDGARNMLHRSRLEQFSDIHCTVAQWIRFRLSDCGKLLRMETAPGDDFFLYFECNDSLSSLGVLYNASRAESAGQLLFFCNPENHTVCFDLRGLPHRELFRLVATENGFAGENCPRVLGAAEYLPANGFAVWDFHGGGTRKPNPALFVSQCPDGLQHFTV